MINGIINVYKEQGFTSHDVVAKLRGILKQKKIGHTGTLDPMATGVLPVCLGNGTKLCDLLTDKSKEYVAQMQLGIRTDTQDITGEVTASGDVNVTKQQLTEIIQSFEGAYQQIPPMYSALKVNGKKLYELAREGKEVERKAREVQIDFITIEKMELPMVQICVGCSKGTYIRTLCDDIGEKAGCFATMTSLTRTRVGNFKVQEALTLVQIEELRDKEKLMEKVVAVDKIFEDMTPVTVAPPFTKLLINGNKLFPNQMIQKIRLGDKEQVRVYQQDVFCAIYEYSDEEQVLKPVKMFLE